MLLLAAPEFAEAQVVYLRRTTIARTLYSRDGTDSTVMQQQCDYDVAVPSEFSVRVGDTVQRAITLSPTLTIIRPYRITEADSAAAPTTVVVAGRTEDFRGDQSFEGDVYVDAANPALLRVRAVGGDAFTRGFASLRESGTPRRCNLTFQMHNELDLGFPSWGLVGSAITIPFRIRPHFSRGTKSIRSEVVTGFAVGYSMAISKWWTRYHYQEGKINPVRSTRKLSGGAFVGLSSGAADKGSTRLADQPLGEGEKASFVSLLPGFSLSYNVLGVDVGAFVGTEHVLGSSAARKWDWHKRPWYGFGVGYDLKKWGF
jgi:hypothetical protein